MKGQEFLKYHTSLSSRTLVDYHYVPSTRLSSPSLIRMGILLSFTVNLTRTFQSVVKGPRRHPTGRIHVPLTDSFVDLPTFSFRPPVPLFTNTSVVSCTYTFERLTTTRFLRPEVGRPSLLGIRPPPPLYQSGHTIFRYTIDLNTYSVSSFGPPPFGPSVLGPTVFSSTLDLSTYEDWVPPTYPSLRTTFRRSSSTRN